MILGGRRDGFTNSAESGAESGGSPNTRRYQLITRESEVRLARANGIVRAHGNRLARECAGASMGAEHIVCCWARAPIENQRVGVDSAPVLCNDALHHVEERLLRVHHHREVESSPCDPSHPAGNGAATLAPW